MLDCQDYCSADYRDSHCAECKCKGCGFCGCKSDNAGDSKFDECADWCSVDFFSSHCRCIPTACPHVADSSRFRFEAVERVTPAVSCSRAQTPVVTHSWCSCKGCGFCKTGPPCDSFLPDDLMYESCDAFCEPEFADKRAFAVD